MVGDNPRPLDFVLGPCLGVWSGAVSCCLVLSVLVVSCLLRSCGVLSCVIACVGLSWLVLSCVVLSCVVLSCLALFVLSCLVFCCHFFSHYHTLHAAFVVCLFRSLRLDQCLFQSPSQIFACILLFFFLRSSLFMDCKTRDSQIGYNATLNKVDLTS